MADTVYVVDDDASVCNAIGRLLKSAQGEPGKVIKSLKKEIFSPPCGNGGCRSGTAG
jgi:FixJ family two-component response regulator